MPEHACLKKSEHQAVYSHRRLYCAINIYSLYPAGLGYRPFCIEHRIKYYNQ